MAFGISGSNTSTNMVGADVVVTWINDDGANAIDYYLTSRQQVYIESCNWCVIYGISFCCDTSAGQGRGFVPIR